MSSGGSFDLLTLVSTIDTAVMNVLKSVSSPAVDKMMIFITKLGDGGAFWILLIALMFIFKKYRNTGTVSAVSLASCFLIGNYVVKPLVGRIRPCNVENAAMLIERMNDFSFPSMHTATAFSISVVVFIKNKLAGSALVILSLLIGVSRIYLNVHYFTDVLAGAAFGTVFALLSVFAAKKLKLIKKL